MSDFSISLQPPNTYIHDLMGSSYSMSTTMFGVCVGVGSSAGLFSVVAIIVLISWMRMARRPVITKGQGDEETAESALRIDELTKQLDAAKVDKENERRRQADAQRELRKVKEQFQSQSQQLENAKRDIEIRFDGAQKQNQNLLLQKRQLENAKWEAETERDNIYRKSQSLTKELNQKQLLLDGRTEELRGAQAFLTTADQYAVADVIRLVEHLNAEIMQVAAAMVDELEVEKIKNAVPLDDGNEVVMRVARILGVALTKLLRKSGDHLSILVQTAFQASMVSYTRKIVSSWSSDAAGIDDILSKIYAQVRETELQPISARWKQLTKATLQRVLDHKADLLPGLVAELGDILVVAGHEERTETLKQRVADRFAVRLGTVFKLAQDLNKQVGQGFTSCDLELLYIDPTTAFNNAKMEDALQPAGSTPPNSRRKTEKIICTTDLGLGRSERTKDSRKSLVLLKAKVILPSGLEEILGGPMH